MRRHGFLLALSAVGPGDLLPPRARDPHTALVLHLGDRNRLPPNKKMAFVIQRAWSSPIWHTPAR